ncbi:Methyltransferase-like protein 24 [Rhizophlyctis rosea]|nr:Methyltransferase-like protein 24 [Rhizophlyctis rosea]
MASDTLPTFARTGFSAGIPKRRLIFTAGGIMLLYVVLSTWSSSDYTYYGSRATTQCNWAVADRSKACRAASREALMQVKSDMEDLEKGTPKYEVCKFKQFGTGWGAHDLCDKQPPAHKSCIFYSFGIDNDYSFDTDMDEKWNCTGILLDPTVNHKASPGPRLNFFKVGATLLNKEDLGGAGTTHRGTVADQWLTTSLPGLKRFLGHEHVNVLKIDCEGCEYALARDVAREDPTFFSKVDQLAIEIHVSRNWIKTSEHVHYLGLLYHMLEVNGFRIMDSKIYPCNSYDEALGCPKEFEEIGYVCGTGKMCHNYLFSRV